MLEAMHSAYREDGKHVDSETDGFPCLEYFQRVTQCPTDGTLSVTRTLFPFVASLDTRSQAVMGLMKAPCQHQKQFLHVKPVAN